MSTTSSPGPEKPKADYPRPASRPARPRPARSPAGVGAKAGSGENGASGNDLLDPYGGDVFGPNNFYSDVDVLTLSVGGTYTLLVAGSVGYSASTTYSFNVQPVADDSATLDVGVPVSGSISHAGQQDRYRFTLGEAKRLCFDALAGSYDINWMLAGPRGTEVSWRSFSSSDSGSLYGSPVLDLVAGDYTLTVDGSLRATGAYGFRLLDLLRPPSAVLSRRNGGKAALWQHGISGDLPIVLLRIDDMDDLAIVRQLMRAFEKMADALQQREAERQQAVKELRQSEERFRALVQNSTDVTGITDKNGLILYRSPNLLTTLGYEVADALGKSIFDYFWPEDLPRAQSRLVELVKAPDNTQRDEYRLRHKNGSCRFIEAISSNQLHDPPLAGLSSTTATLPSASKPKENSRDPAKDCRCSPGRLVEVQETERRHLARELHDEIGQSLMPLSYQKWGKSYTEGSGSPAPRKGGGNSDRKFYIMITFSLFVN